MGSGVKKHLGSVGIGVAMGVVGLMLWQTTSGVHLPVISLSKIGVVLAVLGAVEIVISGGAMLFPSSRHRDDPL